MHGLINRSIQSYVCDCYGTEVWLSAARVAGLETADFEAMLTYEDELTPRILDGIAQVLERPRSEIMEDLGTYLVSHPDFEPARRLLRFGGVDFEDFLHSLDDLPDRARLAVSDLILPHLELRKHAKGQFSLICEPSIAGYSHVVMGVLRVMADDYGALAMLESSGCGHGIESLSIRVVEASYAQGRDFRLGAQAG